MKKFTCASPIKNKIRSEIFPFFVFEEILRRVWILLVSTWTFMQISQKSNAQYKTSIFSQFKIFLYCIQIVVFCLHLLFIYPISLMCVCERFHTIISWQYFSSVHFMLCYKHHTHKLTVSRMASEMAMKQQKKKYAGWASINWMMKRK